MSLFLDDFFVKYCKVSNCTLLNGFLSRWTDAIDLLRAAVLIVWHTSFAFEFDYICSGLLTVCTFNSSEQYIMALFGIWFVISSF